MKDRLIKTKPEAFFHELKLKIHDDIEIHYNEAKRYDCKDILWTNEGLYLLNTTEEYHRLRELFEAYSSKVTAVCCFREKKAYRNSYTKQLVKQQINFSEDKDSYRYVNDDSWIFDYDRKINLLKSTFDNVITYTYNREDNVKAFMDQIRYPIETSAAMRLNVTAST